MRSLSSNLPFMSLIAAPRRLCAFWFVLFILACAGLAGRADDSLGQWILVTPPDFRPALAPLIEHRQAEGFNVIVLETTNLLGQTQPHQPDGAPLQARLNEFIFRNTNRAERRISTPACRRLMS